MDVTNLLPEECISHIISYTSPRDACRLSVVSPAFRSAADSDAVWEKFLPSDYREIISNSASSSTLLVSLSKKDLYFHLCHHPILIGNGTLSFAIEKENGKKCYMIGGRGLSIIWGDDSRYWSWTSLPESRFSEVAALNHVSWLDVKGWMETKILSPKTTYAAYLVFKLTENKQGFEQRLVDLCVDFEGSGNRKMSIVYLDPPADVPRLSREREDGWMEIEIGEFFNELEDMGSLVCSLREHDNFTSKHGLIIEGFELRPKDSS